MFYSERDASIFLPAFLFLFLAPPCLLRENDVPFCFVNYKILVGRVY